MISGARRGNRSSTERSLRESARLTVRASEGATSSRNPNETAPPIVRKEYKDESVRKERNVAGSTPSSRIAEKPPSTAGVKAATRAANLERGRRKLATSCGNMNAASGSVSKSSGEATTPMSGRPTPSACPTRTDARLTPIIFAACLVTEPTERVDG